MSDPRKLNRPSPSESATWFMPGTYKQGNDGNMYTIQVSSSGVHRWIQSSHLTVAHEVFSSKHPNYTGASNPQQMKYKFNVGDKVKVVQGGLGCGIDELDREVFIVKQGEYSNKPGYVVDPAIGNSVPNNHAYSFYNGMIGEASFELVESVVNLKKITPKPLKMAKVTKTITKKTTQEVRHIETSLINKEEVFKMLALAEATGLPLLLVGDPGVNSN